MKIFFIVLLLLPMISVQGADIIRLDGISIQGNSEEPNVLFVTPWQPAPGAGQLFVPIKSYRQHWIKPISRKSMQREIKYLEHFQQKDSYTPDEYETK
jgi:hypothetical protein